MREAKLNTTSIPVPEQHPSNRFHGDPVAGIIHFLVGGVSLPSRVAVRDVTAEPAPLNSVKRNSATQERRQERWRLFRPVVHIPDSVHLIQGLARSGRKTRTAQDFAIQE